MTSIAGSSSSTSSSSSAGSSGQSSSFTMSSSSTSSAPSPLEPSPKPPLHPTPLIGRRVTFGSAAEAAAYQSKEDHFPCKVQNAQVERVSSSFRQRLLKTLDSFKKIHYLELAKLHIVPQAGEGVAPGTMTTEQQLFKRADILCVIELFATSNPALAIFSYFQKFVHLLEDNWKSFPLLHKEKAAPQDQAWDFLLRVFQHMTRPQLAIWDTYLRDEQMKELKTLIQKSTTDEELLQNAKNLLKSSPKLDIFQEMRVRIITRSTGSKEYALYIIAMQVLEEHLAFFSDKLKKNTAGSAQEFLLQMRVIKILEFKADRTKVQAFQEVLITNPNDTLCPVFY